MTVYNGEAFLQETLDSVFAQTFKDFELVVVNNGCTDGTQAILDAVDDQRLRVIQAERHGTFGDGIRLAYQNARCKYIVVQDGDDLSLPDRIAKQVAALDGDLSLGLVVSAYQDINATGSPSVVHYPPASRQDLIDAFQSHNPLAHSTYMFRRVASDQAQGYPREYAYGPDFGLVIRLLKKGWGVKVLGDVLLKLRLHPGQTSILPKFSVARAHDALHLFQEAAGLEGASDAARRAGVRNLTKCRILYGLALSAEGVWGQGVQQVLFALLRHPLYGLAYLGYRLSLRMGWAKLVRA